MNYSVHYVDVTDNLASRVQPVVGLPLHRDNGIPNSTTKTAPGGNYYILEKFAYEDQKPLLVTHGELLRIPMHAYETDHAMTSLVGLGLQLGFVAAERFAKASGRSVETLYLVLGHECHEIRDDMTQTTRFRCYVGIAAHTR